MQVREEVEEKRRTGTVGEKGVEKVEKERRRWRSNGGGTERNDEVQKENLPPPLI